MTPENGQDALTKDRGEVLSVTGPDPDRYFDGSEWQKGDLDRPTTTYSYAEDSPFISRTILPKLDSDDRYYYTESTGHVHGLAQRFVDELGNETFVSRNSSGIAQSTHRFVGGSPDPIHWQNSVDPFDVNNDIEKSVSALDALRIINELNLQAFSSSDGTLVTPRPNNATDYYDVSGDGRVSAVDALQVINELNGRGEAGRPAGEKIERTDYIYVGTQAYDDLVNDPGNSIGIIGTSISSSFRANDLVGAEIIQTGREDSGNGSFIRIYIYNLEDPSATDHGRLREVIETSLDPSNLNSAGDPRPDFSETAASRTKYTYDDNGFLESITDPVDGVTDFTNDELGRPVKVLLPPPGSVKIDGVMTPLARPERNIGYDAFGNVFQVETVADTFVSTSPSNESFFVPRIESHKRLTTYRYDSENRLVAIVEPAPNVDLDADLEQPEIINDPRNGLGSIAGLSSRPVTLYMYDEFGQIQEVSQLLQDGSTSASHVASTSFLYDKLGRAVQRLEPETAVTGTGVSSTLQRPTSYFNYYAGGNLRSTTDPSGLETAQVYDDWSRPTNVLIKQGATYLLRQDLTYESTAFASDAENGVAANRGWTVQSAYTKPGTAGQAGDLLRAEEQSFDQDGQVRETRSLLKDSGSQAGVLDEADLVAIYRHSYFADGQISSTIDPRGNEYSYEYDDLMRLSATIEPWIAAASDTGGPSTTLTGRPVTTYEYDLAGQLTSRTDSTERETTYTYDKLGNIDTISNGKAGASVYTIDYDYNGFSEVSRTVTNPSEYVEPSSGTGANDNSTFTATFSYYDRLGRQTIDQNGFFEQTQYDYDRGSRLVGLTDAADNLTQWAYDQTGKMQSELATIDDPSSGPLATQVVTRLYGYDSVGNLVQEIDREGRVTRYSYDALHQPSTERWYDNTSQFASGNSSGGFNFAYDPIGQLLSVGDQAAVGANYSHEYDYAYDVGGRLTTELQDLQGLSARVSTGWSREYDLSGNAIGVTALTNASLTDGVVSGTVDHHDAMTRDSHNRVSLLNRFVGPDATSTSASDLNSQAVSFTYDREGRLRFMDRDAVRSSTTYGLNTEISYDNAGRVNEVDHSSERVSVPFSAVYSTSWLSSGLVNLTNSLLDSTIADSALQAGSGLQRSFTYDTRGQLQEESINSIANGVTLYEYDTNGNRIGYQQNTTPSAAESIDGDVGADNRLDKDGEAEYKYDKEGNLIRKTYLDATEQDTDDVNWRYTWDHRNRLTQAQRYVGESSLQQTITYAYDAFNRLVRRTDGGVVETFAYDGEEVGLHYINSQLENRYLWQEGVDQLLAEQDTDTGTIAWTLLDRQGNVRDRVRATGNHIQHFDYDAFGREQFVASSSSVTGNADLIFGYTGKMSDEDTGLQHNQNRWYDDSTGRWLSQDPIGFAAGDANLYRYVGNQPTTKTDPSGLADIIDGDPTHGGVIMMLPTGRIIVSGSIMRSHHGPGESTSFLHGYDAIPNPTELAMINILRENGNYCDYQILDRNPTFANTFAYNHLYSPEAGSRTLGTLGYSLFSPPRIAPYAGPVVRPPLKPFYQWRGPRILSAEGQKGLRSPRVVAEIKGDMQAGRYRFKSDEGRIGGYYNEGCYYIGEGHHRMNAAMQIFEETGNSYFVEQLLQHGRWTPRTPPRPGPLPRK
ncbi:RHS repeat-associated core domain-containing protein [Rhodopirellula bahusiensis]|uniref:RHS repeat-associated core domain-containing protein n=1 Tax=Rhodopirellula bahusiensis TaxID=2014065 RepID=UPI003266E8F0